MFRPDLYLPYFLKNLPQSTGKAILFGIFFFTITIINAQQTVSNIGFESGNFNGWLGALGQCCPVYTPQQGIDTSRHQITSGAYFDTFTLGTVPVTCPGSQFSARLGNSNGSAESERLLYSFVPPSDSLILALRFAVILENAAHPLSKQPRFGYEVTTTGAALSGCTSEQIIAGDTNYNFSKNGIIEFLNWQIRYINLTGHSGDTISIQFETGDCEPGGHFGYAYVDCEILSSKIEGNICNDDGSITLFAPTGIHPVWFDGSTADSVVIFNPKANEVYSLMIESQTPCEISLQTTFENQLPTAAFNFESMCDKTVAFITQSIPTTNLISHWNFGDGSLGIAENPVHLYTQPGNFPVTLEVLLSNHCRSSITEIIPVKVSPDAGIDVDIKCLWEPTILKGIILSSHSDSNTFTWIVDQVNISEFQNSTHIFSNSGLHEILFIVENQFGCTDTVSEIINISDSLICDLNPPLVFIPNSFSPNGDGINDYFEINTTGNISEKEMVVFNRFGGIVYRGLKWDGATCPEGVYGLTFSYYSASKKYSKQGYVVLIR